MPELGPDPTYTLHPDGIAPVTDAAYMTALNQRVLDMLTAKVKSQAESYNRLYATNSANTKRIAVLEKALTNCVTMLEAYMVHYDGSPAAKSSTLLQACRTALEE